MPEAGGRREVNRQSVLQAQITELQQQINNVPGQSQGLRGYVPVNDASHGFSVGEAVGYDGTDWELADESNVSGYTLRGYVVAVPDANNFIAMVGVGYIGNIPEISGSSTWDTYWLSNSTPGSLSTTKGSSIYPWLQILDEKHLATICDIATTATEAESGTVIDVNQASHGFDEGEAIGRNSASGSWYIIDASSLPNLFDRGIVLEDVDTDNFKVLTRGYGTLASAPVWAGTNQILYLDATQNGSLVTSKDDGDIQFARQYDDSTKVYIDIHHDWTVPTTTTNHQVALTDACEGTITVGVSDYSNDASGIGYLSYYLQDSKIYTCGFTHNFDENSGKMTMSTVSATTQLWPTTWTTLFTTHYVASGASTIYGVHLQARVTKSSGVATLELQTVTPASGMSDPYAVELRHLSRDLYLAK